MANFVKTGRNWFLTYSGKQLTEKHMNREEFVAEMKQRFAKRNNTEIEMYVVAEETYKDGDLHYHALLRTSKKIKITNERFFDYEGAHPSIELMRNLTATLAYLNKTDVAPYASVDISTAKEKARREQSYQSLIDVMVEHLEADPERFDPDRYIYVHGLIPLIVGKWGKDLQSVVKMIEKARETIHRQIEEAKPGLRLITPELISERLSAEELQEFHDNPGYQQIVDCVNQMYHYEGNRPHKSPNLLIVGEPNTGKTSFITEITKHVRYYGLSMKNWIPRYKNHQFHLMRWEEVEFTDFPRALTKLLLEGMRCDFPQKGSSILRIDNPLIMMTSNSPFLKICERARRRREDDETLYMDLIKPLSVRIIEVTIPKGKDIFFMQKLIVPKEAQ